MGPAMGIEGNGESSRGSIPRSSEAHGGSSLLDERGKAWKSIGVSDAIKEIAEEINAEFLGRADKRLKGIPRPNSLRGTSL